MGGAKSQTIVAKASGKCKTHQVDLRSSKTEQILVLVLTWSEGWLHSELCFGATYGASSIDSAVKQATQVAVAEAAGENGVCMWKTKISSAQGTPTRIYLEVRKTQVSVLASRSGLLDRLQQTSQKKVEAKPKVEPKPSKKAGDEQLDAKSEREAIQESLSAVSNGTRSCSSSECAAREVEKVNGRGTVEKNCEVEQGAVTSFLPTAATHRQQESVAWRGEKNDCGINRGTLKKTEVDGATEKTEAERRADNDTAAIPLMQTAPGRQWESSARNGDAADCGVREGASKGVEGEGDNDRTHAEQMVEKDSAAHPLLETAPDMPQESQIQRSNEADCSDEGVGLRGKRRNGLGED